MSAIVSTTTLAEFASLLGDPARASIVIALMDGRALTAGELSWIAGVSASTTSEHLAKLSAGGIIAVEKQGRHRYVRLARPEVAAAVEVMMAAGIDGPRRYRPVGPRDATLRTARSCYDHMAGRLGVGIAAALVRCEAIRLDDAAAALTAHGERFLANFGIDLAGSGASKRPLCRTCLDWSERRPHLAGRLGAALFSRSLALGWVGRQSGTRALAITPAGRQGFAGVFGIEIA
ncbi:MAG: winged helix-turn-helix domain-containing protein [Ancalomicrobiaceae bacterium]|nr:winged helix-turn-helix domain-containing protein [Ancalomicrobiaceae bacterium]